MEKHYGEIIEKVIRRNGYGISEVSRMMKLNRRSMYNWFSQHRLKAALIFKLGVALRHDFSRDFPELFSSEEFEKAFEQSRGEFALTLQETQEANHWKDKYITLLEQYNAVLAYQARVTA